MENGFYLSTNIKKMKSLIVLINTTLKNLEMK